jgi:hypothetical protein
MRSEKGKRPVPPATTIILPGLVISNSKPLPFGLLSFNYEGEKDVLLSYDVNLPFP